jgi:hypothetical protein
MTTAPDVHVVGSASIWVLGQVAGPRRVAKVLHAGRSAVYLDLSGTCLAVLAARAVQVPCGVRTMLPALPAVHPGDEAAVVDGSIEIPGCEVMVTDIVDTTVPVLTPEAATWGAEHLARRASPRVAAARHSLPAESLTRLATGDPDSVDALLGLGPGLTPLGDDVLCGWLATAVAHRHPALDDVRSTVALEARRRTTTLSTTLLSCASRGEGVPEFRALLSGVASQNAAAVEQSVELVLRVGETSGEGILLGALLALQGVR